MLKLWPSQIELFAPGQASAPGEQWLAVGAARLPLLFVKNPRARRYVLRLTRDGRARVTVPRGGSLGEARKFAGRHISWLEKQLVQRARQTPVLELRPGASVLFRGELWILERNPTSLDSSFIEIRLGPDVLRVPSPLQDLRPAVESHLRAIANRELPRRVLELAAQHGFQVHRITVRSQRSRWGSCSRRATISLNWRLVQMPETVRDYIILHELAHLRVMNHSERFWREVERLCPWYKESERWLKQNRHRL